MIPGRRLDQVLSDQVVAEFQRFFVAGLFLVGVPVTLRAVLFDQNPPLLEGLLAGLLLAHQCCDHPLVQTRVLAVHRILVQRILDDVDRHVESFVFEQIVDELGHHLALVVPFAVQVFLDPGQPEVFIDFPVEIPVVLGQADRHVFDGFGAKHRAGLAGLALHPITVFDQAFELFDRLFEIVEPVVGPRQLVESLVEKAALFVLHRLLVGLARQLDLFGVVGAVEVVLTDADPGLGDELTLGPFDDEFGKQVAGLAGVAHLVVAIGQKVVGAIEQSVVGPLADELGKGGDGVAVILAGRLGSRRPPARLVALHLPLISFVGQKVVVVFLFEVQLRQPKHGVWSVLGMIRVALQKVFELLDRIEPALALGLGQLFGAAVVAGVDLGATLAVGRRDDRVDRRLIVLDFVRVPLVGLPVGGHRLFGRVGVRADLRLIGNLRGGAVGLIGLTALVGLIALIGLLALLAVRRIAPVPLRAGLRIGSRWRPLGALRLGEPGRRDPQHQPEGRRDESQGDPTLLCASFQHHSEPGVPAANRRRIESSIASHNEGRGVVSELLRTNL